ncbi:MAG: hypothetical protein WKG06_02590 [Segetibacter sp.]
MNFDKQTLNLSSIADIQINDACKELERAAGTISAHSKKFKGE